MGMLAGDPAVLAFWTSRLYLSKITAMSVAWASLLPLLSVEMQRAIR